MPALFFMSPRAQQEARASRSQRRRAAVVNAGLLACLIVFGLMSDDLGLLDTLGTVFMYVVLTQAWNILGGYGGYLNFGMASFFGLGAYASALLYQFYGLSPFLTAPVAGLIVGLFGWCIGVPTLRLRGAYFAVITMIITFALQIAVLDAQFTQGALGIYLAPLSLGPRHVEELFYFLYLALAALATALVYGIQHSNFGWALVAIREDEDAAEIIGVRTTSMKRLALVLGAFMAGAVGGIYAERVLYIEPTGTFALDISLNVVLMAVIGGAGSWQGPLIGAPLVLLAAEALRVTVSTEANRVVFSLVVILIAVFVPDGVMGLVRRARRGGRFGPTTAPSQGAQAR